MNKKYRGYFNVPIAPRGENERLKNKAKGTLNPRQAKNEEKVA